MSSHVERFYSMLKIPAAYETDTSQARLTVISCQVSYASLADYLLVTARDLVDESGMIRTQMGNAT
jgi:hypothetical protein